MDSNTVPEDAQGVSRGRCVMSRWAYVKGLVTVRSEGRTQPECRYVLETVLDHLPIVTGSEGNMTVHIVQAEGHSSSQSTNEFWEYTEAMRSHPWYADGSWLDVQDRYLLVLEGHLRDKEFEETKREVTKWLTRLAKRLLICDVYVKVWDGWSKSVVIDDVRPYEDMYEEWYEPHSGVNHKRWVDYLLWERVEESSYPKKLLEYYEEREG